MVAADVEPALLRRNVKRHQGDRNVDIEEHPALQAVHMIVPFDTPVVAACLIGERQFLDQSVLGEEVQRPVDRAVRDAGVAPSYALENLASGQVALRLPHLIENFSALRCISESLPRHHTTRT
jgi:hypothetical protein